MDAQIEKSKSHPLLKKFAFAQLGNLLLAIPASLLIAFFIWFFLKVVLHAVDTGLVDFWGYLYIVMLVAFFLWDLRFILHSWHVMRGLAKRLDMPYEAIYKAYIVEKLYKEKPTSEWTKDWVESQFAISQFAENFAKAMMSSRR
jgi:hypothetical protein